jgi:molybdopterin synthase catalytic subunit
MTDSIQVNITDQPIDCGQLLQNHGAPEHGAQVSFFGIVRSVNLGRTVVGMEYDAFKPLAETTFRTFSAEAQARWGSDVRITIAHRVGALAVGAISVALIVSTRHRAEAYAVSRYLIEELKHRSPIWKKEHYSDGSSDWVQGHALCQHASAEPVDEQENLQSHGTGARL